MTSGAMSSTCYGSWLIYLGLNTDKYFMHCLDGVAGIPKIPSEG